MPDLQAILERVFHTRAGCHSEIALIVRAQVLETNWPHVLLQQRRERKEGERRGEKSVIYI